MTTATLNAILKYPWKRDESQKDERGIRYRKFGVYREDLLEFNFVRKNFKSTDSYERSLEAQIMDYSDEVAYSVHDFEDFFRAGFIPADNIRQDGEEYTQFIENWIKDLLKEKDSVGASWISDRKTQMLNLLEYLPESYKDTFEDRTQLRHFSSYHVSRFVSDATVKRGNLSFRDHTGRNFLEVENTIKYDLKFMQRFIWVYVIRNPRLASQQLGQRRIIRTLFGQYLVNIRKNNLDLIPASFKGLVDLLHKDFDNDRKRKMAARLAADIVSSLNDQQAVTIYNRFMGIGQGSIHDAID